jgi:hypothetical protein
MTDYRRAMWQARANKIAVWSRWTAIFVLVPEVWALITYHFPMWDDIALPATFVIHQIARFVQVHTEQYRIDY